MEMNERIAKMYDNKNEVKKNQKEYVKKFFERKRGKRRC